MEDDATLLRRYVFGKSESAFAELVERRIGLVYSVALRQCGGDAHLAEDVTQKVFADLARKAAQLCRRPVLSGWLCRSAQFAASDLVRAERRRRAREEETHLMQAISSNPAAVPDWDKLRPVLDQLMNELGDDDRDALALRFFEERSFAEIGSALQLTEEAARKRVMRALDRLHSSFARRGVASTSAALAGALASQAGVAAPAGLAASVTGAALSGGGAAATGAGTWAIFMSMTKLQVAIVGAIVVAGATGFVAQAVATGGLHDELASLRRQNQAVTGWEMENTRLARTVKEAESARAGSAELRRLQGEMTALRERLQKASVSGGAKPAVAQPLPATFTGQFFEPSQVDQPSKPLFQARPNYPADLRKLAVEGRATVDFIIDAKGLVHNATALDATHPSIGAAAVEAVSQWEYEPAQKGGQPVALHLQVPIIFTIGESMTMKVTGKSAPAKPPPPAFAPWF